MASRPASPITELLTAASRGDAAAAERLWALVYDELKRMARGQLVGEARGRTLHPTVLVNETYLRLLGDGHVDWSSRGHFFAAAAEAMRRIRVDDARKRNRLKRGGGRKAQSLDEEQIGSETDATELLAVHEVLDRLEEIDPRKAEVVKMRYFAGLSVDETAAALGVSPRTVDAEWRFAKAWLHRQLSKGDTAGG